MTEQSKNQCPRNEPVHHLNFKKTAFDLQNLILFYFLFFSATTTSDCPAKELPEFLNLDNRIGAFSKISFSCN